jgi:hypothetical protein
MTIFRRAGREESWTRPESMTSYWLRGRVRDDPDAKKYGPEPNKAAAEAVLTAAFTLAIRRRFAQDPSLRAQAGFARYLIDTFRPRLRPIDVEAVIRAELDDQVSIDDLDYRTVILTKMLATPEALKQLNLSDRELDELFYEAERVAVARGFSPDPIPQ